QVRLRVARVAGQRGRHRLCRQSSPAAGHRALLSGRSSGGRSMTLVAAIYGPAHHRSIARAAWATLLLLVVLFGGPPQVAAQEYRLGSQDKVTVTVYGEPDLSGDFELDGGGKMALPLLGEVRVGDMTLREAEQAIAARLHPDYLIDPKVSIQ